MEFKYDGEGLAKSGSVTLYVDGGKIGEGRVDMRRPIVHRQRQRNCLLPMSKPCANSRCVARWPSIRRLHVVAKLLSSRCSASAGPAHPPRLIKEIFLAVLLQRGVPFGNSELVGCSFPRQLGQAARTPARRSDNGATAYIRTARLTLVRGQPQYSWVKTQSALTGFDGYCSLMGSRAGGSSLSTPPGCLCSLRARLALDGVS